MNKKTELIQARIFKLNKECRALDAKLDTLGVFDSHEKKEVYYDIGFRRGQIHVLTDLLENKNQSKW